CHEEQRTKDREPDQAPQDHRHLAQLLSIGRANRQMGGLPRWKGRKLALLTARSLSPFGADRPGGGTRRPVRRGCQNGIPIRPTATRVAERGGGRSGPSPVT